MSPWTASQTLEKRHHRSPQPTHPEPTIRTLTERIEREMALTRQSLSRQVEHMGIVGKYLDGLLDSLDSGVIAVDAMGRVMTINRTAEEMLGIGTDRAQGMHYEELAGGILPSSLLMEAIRTEQPPCPSRQALLRPDGKQFLVECSVSLIRDARARVIGALQVMKDLSPIEALEKKLEHSARLAYLGKVAATLAHEVRNPLSAIEGFAYLLAHDMDMDDARRRFAENIIAAVRDLEQAVTSTLIFARPPQLRIEPIRVCALLDEAKHFAAHEIAAKHLDDISVTTTTGPALERLAQVEGEPLVLGDREQLKRVLLNLAKNAMDAMPDGGEITFQASVSPESSEERPMTRLSVLDTGIGIQPEIRARLFEPFETTKSHGNGLGLAVVKTIVELHGGKVSAESTPGRGTAFHLDMPASCSREVICG